MADSMPSFGSARILVVHEWLLDWAGAERQLDEIMRVVPQADLVVGAAAGRILQEHPRLAKARETWLANVPGARTSHRWLIPLQYPAFAGIDTRGYDLVISSSSGFGKAVRPSDGRPHLCYCYSPPRYLWGVGDTYRKHEGAATRAMLALGSGPLRALDRASASGVTHFIGISRFVADRIRRAYGREASVIYPAVEPKPTPPGTVPREDFLLTLGRLVSYKRVDLAIGAARRAGVRLVIAGDGPDRARLERNAGPGVEFTGRIDEATAGDLMRRCRAFLFCAEEDFGIAPIEANAHGAPVVGLRRGALTETMSDDTATFFDEPEPASAERAVRAALARSWDEGALRANAARFAPERFRAEFRAAVSAVLSRG